MKELATIYIMKGLPGFYELNSFVLSELKKFGDKIVLKGDSRFKTSKLEVLNSALVVKDNDITHFILEGEGYVTQKKILGSKAERVKFKLDTITPSLETNYSDKKTLLILLILFYMDLIKQYAKKAKETMKDA